MGTGGRVLKVEFELHKIFALMIRGIKETMKSTKVFGVAQNDKFTAIILLAGKV